MLKRIFSMFRGSKPVGNSGQIASYNNGAYEAAAGNEDILSGYQFSATLNPRTPLCILLRHGTVSATLPRADERTSPADGIWMPKVKSWKELGLPFKDLPSSQIASAVGLIPEDGGEFLRMLIAFRREVESVGTPRERAERAYRVICSREEWREFASTLGWNGPDSLDDYVGYPEALGVDSLSVALAKSLYLAGFVSQSALREATDEALLAVKGVGPKRLREIRTALGRSPKA